MNAETIRPGDVVTVGKGTLQWRVAWIDQNGQARLRRGGAATGPRSGYAHVDRLRKTAS